ncbi:hypothetical protein [Prosthecomicrobium sp. N25]|uniref:hypothetical protein n=1 Tax=Prosthecomicrobium sp. N25 TaxID=3129254 RepID=UPI003078A132
MAGSAGWHVLRALAVTVGLALAAGGVSAVSGEATTAPLRDVALQIERKGVGDPSFFERAERRSGTVLDAPGCSRDLVRSAATLRVARLETAAVQAQDATEAIAAADRTLRAALACRPIDGNLWLRLAVVAVARDGFTPAAEDLLRRSIRLAPAEDWIMAARVRFLGALVESGILEAEALFASEAETYMRRARVYEIVALYAAAGPAARAAQEAMWAALGEDRMSRIQRQAEIDGVYRTP